MKQGKTEKAVFTKLSKVELNLTRNLDALTSNLNGMSRETDGVINILEEAHKKYINALDSNKKYLLPYRDMLNDIKKLMSQMEQQAKELGINPSDIKGYMSANSAVDLAEKNISKLESNLNRYK